MSIAKIIRWSSEQRASNPPTQALYDRAAELGVLLHLFNDASWPYLGSGFGLVDHCVRGIDRMLESLCRELAADRYHGVIYAAAKPVELEGDWRARLEKLSNGVARLPQVAALLSELRPKATALRSGCLELVERAPNAPLPILSAAKSAIIALDRWLDARPIFDELNRLRTECEALRVVAEAMGADEVASSARRAVEALPPLPPNDDELELQRSAQQQADAITAGRVRQLEMRAQAERV